MATEASILFDFRQALAQANKLEELAESLKNSSNKQFENALQNLAINWKGENAEKYLAKGSLLQGKMQVTADGLQSVADEIRTIAKRVYDAEMRALILAQSRTY